MGRFDHNPSGQFWMRHPQASGRILQDLARRDYVIAEGVVVKFFEEDGVEPLLKRHRLNRDQQANTVKRYCEIIQESGIKKGARSEVVLVPSSTDMAAFAAIRASLGATGTGASPVPISLRAFVLAGGWWSLASRPAGHYSGLSGP